MLCAAVARMTTSTSMAVERTLSAEASYVPIRFVQSVSLPDLKASAGSRRPASVNIPMDPGKGLQRSLSFADYVDAQTAAARRRKAATLTVLIIAAGCATVIPFELLQRKDRGCGDLISLMEYAWAAAVSLPALRKEQKVPWQAHGLLCFCGVAYSALCNRALALALPMPVFLVMKNGVLVANMLVGWAALGRLYSIKQLLAVLCVSIGLVVTTLASKLQKEEQDALAVADEAGWSIGVAEARAFLSALLQNAAEVGDVDPFKALRSDFGLGVCCMLGALLSRAVGGAVQERVFKRYGPHIQEVMFWKSVLGIPFFALGRVDAITSHAAKWAANPVMWGLLLAEVSGDYVTGRAVASLIAGTSSLTAQVVLTLQHFLSLAFSAAVLNAPPAPPTTLWVGAFLVLVGALAYTVAPPHPGDNNAAAAVSGGPGARGSSAVGPRTAAAAAAAVWREGAGGDLGTKVSSAMERESAVGNGKPDTVKGSAVARGGLQGPSVLRRRRGTTTTTTMTVDDDANGRRLVRTQSQ